jgi:hypothetical protein
MEGIISGVDQAEEGIPGIKDKVEELLHSHSNKENKAIMTTTFMAS